MEPMTPAELEKERLEYNEQAGLLLEALQKAMPLFPFVVTPLQPEEISEASLTYFDIHSTWLITIGQKNLHLHARVQRALLDESWGMLVARAVEEIHVALARAILEYYHAAT